MADQSENAMDALLVPNPNRFTLFPIKHHDIWKMYKTAVNSFWVVEELKLDSDVDDWNNKLNENERFYLKHILAFFANADAIVNENLLERFINEVQYTEAQYFYRFQATIEDIHWESYSLFIDTYIKDRDEKTHLLNAVENVPCVKKKADWALKWISDKNSSFGERLLAFALVEGLFFSGSFAAIFYFRSRGLLKGLSQANTLISRDEALHCSFACLLYRDHLYHNKPDEATAVKIIKEACELEKEFQCDALPCSLIGLNQLNMCQYIEYVADYMAGLLGLNHIYGVKNPFPFMELISLDSCENFFEEKAVNYSMGMSERKFSIDEDF